MQIEDLEALCCRSALQLLGRYPEDIPPDSTVGLELHEHAARHLEHLDAALSGDDDALFTDYIRWISRYMVRRGLPRKCLKDHLRILGDLLQGHLPPADILAVERLMALPASSVNLPVVPDERLPSDPALAEASHRLLESLLKGDRTGALDLVEEVLAEGHTVATFYTDVLQPVMYAIGDLWLDDQITWQEEHTATAVLPSVFTRCRKGLSVEPGSPERKMLLTGVERELHEVSLQVLSDVLRSEGWRVRNLGANNPDDVIVGTARYERPAVIGISVTLPVNLPVAENVIAMIRREADLAGCRVVVGGGAFRRSDDAWSRIGADALCDGPRELMDYLGTVSPGTPGGRAAV